MAFCFGRMKLFLDSCHLNCTMTYISVMIWQEKMSNKVVALKVRHYVDITSQNFQYLIPQTRSSGEMLTFYRINQINYHDDSQWHNVSIFSEFLSSSETYEQAIVSSQTHLHHLRVFQEVQRGHEVPWGPISAEKTSKRWEIFPVMSSRGPHNTLNELNLCSLSHYLSSKI